MTSYAIVLVWSLNLPACMHSKNYSARTTSEWVVTPVSGFSEYYEENSRTKGIQEDKHNATTWMSCEGNDVI